MGRLASGSGVDDQLSNNSNKNLKRLGHSKSISHSNSQYNFNKFNNNTKKPQPQILSQLNSSQQYPSSSQQIIISPQLISLVKDHQFYFFDKQKSDIFILGGLLIQLCLLSQQCSINLHKNEFKKNLQPLLQNSIISSKYSRNFIQLLQKMVKIDPKQRPNLSEIIERIEECSIHESSSIGENSGVRGGVNGGMSNGKIINSSDGKYNDINVKSNMLSQNNNNNNNENENENEYNINLNKMFMKYKQYDNLNNNMNNNDNYNNNNNNNYNNNTNTNNAYYNNNSSIFPQSAIKQLFSKQSNSNYITNTNRQIKLTNANIEIKETLSPYVPLSNTNSNSYYNINHSNNNNNPLNTPLNKLYLKTSHDNINVNKSMEKQSIVQGKYTLMESNSNNMGSNMNNMNNMNNNNYSYMNNNMNGLNIISKHINNNNINSYNNRKLLNHTNPIINHASYPLASTSTYKNTQSQRFSLNKFGKIQLPIKFNTNNNNNNVNNVKNVNNLNNLNNIINFSSNSLSHNTSNNMSMQTSMLPTPRFQHNISVNQSNNFNGINNTNNISNNNYLNTNNNYMNSVNTWSVNNNHNYQYNINNNNLLNINNINNNNNFQISTNNVELTNSIHINSNSNTHPDPNANYLPPTNTKTTNSITNLNPIPSYPHITSNPLSIPLTNYSAKSSPQINLTNINTNLLQKMNKYADLNNNVKNSISLNYNYQLKNQEQPYFVNSNLRETLPKYGSRLVSGESIENRGNNYIRQFKQQNNININNNQSNKKQLSYHKSNNKKYNFYKNQLNSQLQKIDTENNTNKFNDKINNNNNNITKINNNNNKVQSIIKKLQSQPSSIQNIILPPQNQSIQQMHSNNTITKNKLNSAQSLPHQLSIPSDTQQSIYLNNKIESTSHFITSEQQITIHNNINHNMTINNNKNEQNNQIHPNQTYYTQSQQPGGSVYKGYKVNNLKNGHGRLMFIDGGYYQGMFKDDMMEGQGKLYYNQSDIAYQGQFKQNNFHGYGVLYNDNPREILIGDNVNTGSSNFYSNSFDFANMSNLSNYWKVFKGYFKNDQKAGKCTIILTNGEQFQGYCHNNTIEGVGKFKTINGDVIEGVWVNNVLVEIKNEVKCDLSQ